MSRIATVRAKHLRRRILDILKAARSAGGDGWISLKALFAYLTDETDALTGSELADEVRYLAEASKGYAETRDVRERKTDPPLLQARILPKGIDLVEGGIPPDPGIEDDRP